MLTLTQNQVEENEVSYSSCSREAEESSSMTSILVDSNTESNSRGVIGSPLQTSSPAAADIRGEGDGDRNSLRTICNHLSSPMQCLRTRRQMSYSMIQTPSQSQSSPNTTTSQVTPDSFLANFENSSSPRKSLQPYSLEQELLLSEKISKMEDDEAKKLLTKVLIDNMGLRQELKVKEKRITAFKGQMLAIIDWKVKQESDTESCGNNSQNVTPNKFLMSKGDISMTTGFPTGCVKTKEENENSYERNMIPHKTLHSSQELTMIEETNGVRRSLSFIHELASSIDLDRELLKDRLKGGYHLSNQVLVGGVTGWLSALFVRKFGKLALSATGGGLILLVYTARKGFVHVNYESIYQELSRLCDNTDGDGNYEGNDDLDVSRLSSGTMDLNLEGSLGKKCNNSSHVGESLKSRGPDETRQLCAYDKLRQAKNWITSHTYAVGGFAIAFIYNLV